MNFAVHLLGLLAIFPLFVSGTVDIEVHCKPGYFISADGECHPCQNGCDACSSNTNCSECKHGHFLKSDGACYPCSDGCVSCTSETTCTKCKDNRYGPACQSTCVPNCLYECHKVYGYCSENCPDGQFPNLTTKQCKNCTPTCEVCSAPTQCIVCKPGYFSVNDVCHKCIEGCERCNRDGTCSLCMHGYFGPYTGECVVDCNHVNTTKRSVIRKGKTTYTFPETDCDKISADKVRSSGSMVGRCISKSKCAEGVNCRNGTKDSFTKAEECGILDTFRCDGGCLRLNETFCHCQAICTSGGFQQNPKTICLNDSNERIDNDVSEKWIVKDLFHGPAPQNFLSCYLTSALVGVMALVICILLLMMYYEKNVFSVFKRLLAMSAGFIGI